MFFRNKHRKDVLFQQLIKQTKLRCRIVQDQRSRRVLSERRKPDLSECLIFILQIIRLEKINIVWKCMS